MAGERDTAVELAQRLRFRIRHLPYGGNDRKLMTQAAELLDLWPKKKARVRKKSKAAA